jgi:hypothetical protein
MAIRTTEDRTTQSSATADKSGNTTDLLADVRLLWVELCGLTHDHLKLVSLEVERAGRSFVSMMVAGLIMAVLLISVWFGLMAAAALALIESHMVGAIEAILLIVAANLAVVLLLLRFMRHKSHYLLFPDTVRSLQDKEV